MNDQEMLAEVRACNARLVEELMERQAEYGQLQKAYDGLLENCGKQEAEGQHKEAELAVFERQLTEANLRIHEEREINRALKAQLMAERHHEDSSRLEKCAWYGLTLMRTDQSLVERLGCWSVLKAGQFLASGNTYQWAVDASIKAIESAGEAEDEPEAPVDPLIPPQDWKGGPA